MEVWRYHALRRASADRNGMECVCMQVKEALSSLQDNETACSRSRVWIGSEIRYSVIHHRETGAEERKTSQFFLKTE
jgi:hypothetical protein